MVSAICGTASHASTSVDAFLQAPIPHFAISILEKCLRDETQSGLIGPDEIARANVDGVSTLSQSAGCNVNASGPSARVFWKAASAVATPVNELTVSRLVASTILRTPKASEMGIGTPLATAKLIGIFAGGSTSSKM
jgi:hypothetical protein